MTKKKINPEDVELFRQSVGKVRAVKSDKLILQTEKKPKPFPKASSIDVEGKLTFNEDHDLEKLSLEDTISFTAPGLQKNVLKKMRRGYFGVDAELDLHGLSSNEAKYQLLRFLHSCVENGCRCVHIIHGKGYRSPDNIPVLKNNINLWLRQHQDVQAFCSARPKDGGTGAVLVLLRLAEKYGEQDDTQ